MRHSSRVAIFILAGILGASALTAQNPRDTTQYVGMFCPRTAPGFPCQFISGSSVVYNGRDFGMVCDGVANDAPALQRALNAAETASQGFFGTSLVGTPTVLVPMTGMRSSPSGGTIGCVLNSSIRLPRGVTLAGEGTFAPILVVNHANVAFYEYGTTEAAAASITVRNLFVFQNTASASVGIGFRFRNFDFVQLQNVTISNFRVGVWADWGVHLTVYNTAFSLNKRGLQLGGDLSQTETPVPPAGVRGAPGTPFLDGVVVNFSTFSQDSLDINDMGSQQSLGGLAIQGSSFFESSTSPVTGKTRFATFTRRKGLVISGNWFESPNASRDLIRLDSVDANGNQAAPVWGANIFGNHLLATNATGANAINDVRCGGCAVWGNTIEIANSGSTAGIAVADPATPLWIGTNAWLAFPDIELVGSCNACISAGTGSGGPGGNYILGTGGTDRSLVQITYAASMTPNAAAATLQNITATNGVAFTINAPTNPHAGELTIQITNSSGGVLGAATWTGGAGGFILTGGAWVQPANTLHRMITFLWNGTSYIEAFRTAADF